MSRTTSASVTPLPIAPGSWPPCPGSMTMRDTPSPSCRAIENPPFRFLAGAAEPSRLRRPRTAGGVSTPCSNRCGGGLAICWRAPASLGPLRNGLGDYDLSAAIDVAARSSTPRAAAISVAACETPTGDASHSAVNRRWRRGSFTRRRAGGFASLGNAEGRFTSRGEAAAGLDGTSDRAGSAVAAEVRTQSITRR